MLQGQAQILKSIVNSAANQAQKSATNKVSEKVNKQVDKGVNKLFDSLIKDDTTKVPEKEVPSAEGNSADKAPAALNGFMKKLGVSTEAIPHKDNYQFTAKVVIVFEATDEKGEKVTSTETETCVNEKTSDVLFRISGAAEVEASSITIIDKENSCMLNLSELNGKKSGFATKFDPNAANTLKPMPETPQSEGTTQTKDDDCTPVLSGKKEKISGFNCQEYRCESDESIVSVWVTKDLSNLNNKLFSNPAIGANYNTDGFDGMVIKYETKSKDDKSSSLMLFKSIDMNKSSSFSTVGYEISSFNINSKK
jgi:hypothetical protein